MMVKGSVLVHAPPTAGNSGGAVDRAGVLTCQRSRTDWNAMYEQLILSLAAALNAAVEKSSLIPA